MFIVTVRFIIDPNHMDRFLVAMRLQAQTSLVVEEGCRQFDVCQSPDTPAEVFLYEVYDSATAFDLHIASDHFREFDQTIIPWVTEKSIQIFERIYP